MANSGKVHGEGTETLESFEDQKIIIINNSELVRSPVMNVFILNDKS